MFEPGNKLSTGRPKGSGKGRLFREWCETIGIQKLIDIAEGKGHDFKIHGQKILEVGPSVTLQLEAIRLMLAYGLGRPVTPFLIDDRSRSPEESQRRASEVMQLIRELENDANSGAETGSDRGSVGDRPAEV